MKSIFIVLISLTIFSCKNINSTPIEEEEYHMRLHKEMDKVDAEYTKFQKQLVAFYIESEKNPDLTLSKVDSLLSVYKNEKDKYKLKIKSTIEDQLHYLKAELYYKKSEYGKSIKELDFDDDFDFVMGDRACAYAANYLKLKQYDKAKSFVDSIRKGYYIYDYALANYNESVGNRNEAFKIYGEIKNDKSIKHYAYYKLAVNRFQELEKDNPKLLNEIYFPTGNPSFEIADSDHETRSKIFNLMEKLPESKNWAGTSIVESPQENDKNYYWVKVKTQQNKTFNYYIYQGTFEIKFLDTINNKLLTLEEWRKSK
ncbi:hypothetical protein NAT51_08065 [Flavobacterium amniphilum]|uniref:hypothetical protein n=1 Tax=Flavobacterium amniphilum TaxID=1834035 RepID=UPI002029D3EC|nr:hypothetical protein [Flavobacterium amniphilum]MCL9805473.1 hypothetical protein [Flavobacterium amniphilum]